MNPGNERGRDGLVKDAAAAVCGYWCALLNTHWKERGNHCYWGLSAACGFFCEKAAILRDTEKFPRCVRKFTARLEQIQYLVAHVHCRRWSPRMLSATDFNVHPHTPLAIVGMWSRPAAMGRRGQDMCVRVVGMAVEWRLWATYESKVAFRSW